MTASLRVSAEILELRTRHPFIIARGGSSDYRTVWVKVTDKDGREGWGEAPESVLAAINLFAAAMPADPFDLETAEAQWGRMLRGNPAARVALSTALHDLAAQRAGVPLHRLWGLDPKAAPRSTFTIGLDSEDAVAFSEDPRA